MQLTISIPDSQQVVRLPSGVVEWSEEEFFRFCQSNRDLRIERSVKGEIIVMSPAGGYSSFQNLEVATQLNAWARKDGSGIAFDSSAGFRLPNGAMRSPDAAWVQLLRLPGIEPGSEAAVYSALPRFVIEVASPSDDVAELRAKMEEYRAAGVRLGWLILPDSRQVEIYTSTEVQTLTAPEAVTADPVLPGSRLDLALIWSPPF